MGRAGSGLLRKYTTGLHVEREAELTELVREAAAETRGRLGTDAISAAVARSGRDFVATEHGRSQRAAMNTLGTGGAFTAVIGVAGSGKTTLLQPLVDAYGTAGVRVYGTASGWKQTLALAETGIPKERCLALAKLLADAGARQAHPWSGCGDRHRRARDRLAPATCSV